MNPPDHLPASSLTSAFGESERLLVLCRYRILDTGAEPGFDDLVRLAARVCEVPMAGISFIEVDREWFKSVAGLAIKEVPRRHGFSEYLLRSGKGGVYEVRDASAGSRFLDNPLVAGSSKARFYAGVPLLSPEGHALGTLFVLDVRPRQLDDEQRELLVALGRQVMALLELRRMMVPATNATLLTAVQSRTTESALDRRVADLKSASEQLESFAFSVSNDLCSPLKAIDLSARQLDGLSPAGSEPARHVAAILQSVRQMRQLVTGLLQFSRFSRQPLHRQRIAMSRLAGRTLDELSDESSGRALAVEIGDLPDCHADPLLIKQVFAHLLGNALKFTARCAFARIQVGWERHGDEVVYSVSDNGVGFDMRKAGRLFGLFQRLHRTGEYDGTGVGLSIVQRILQRHGGRIWAEGRPDHGATFYFTLPD